MKNTLTIATRNGALAIAQTRIVVDKIRKLNPRLDIRIKKIASHGDKDRRTTLWELKSTGFFTSLLEDALLAKKADIAVHSFKDLPTSIRDGLTIAAVLDRKFPEDCLVTASPAKTIYDLPNEAVVGTSSLRRTVQLKRLRVDLKCVPIRGNVTTRLKKLQQGEFDAIILARAGLERLGLADKISIVFDPAEFIPSPAQGALAVQVRTDDAETKKIVSKLNSRIACVTASAEREVFSALGCGCHAPAGVFAKVSGKKIKISACFSNPDGSNFRKASISGPIADSSKLARRLADKLR